MRRFIVVAAAVALAVTGCASRKEWEDWKSHSTHFASGEHMAFSIKNRFRHGARAEVTSEDNKDAGQTRWWGVHTLKQGDDLTPKDDD